MGLELDLGVVIKRAKTSLAISFSGICLTFAISVGVSSYFYNYIDGVSLVDYTKFMLYIGVAMCITELPDLARILTEQNLLHTPVGISVISAAVVDDAVGWAALALVVVVVSSLSALVCVYIFLTIIVFSLFMYYVIRPILERVFDYVSGAGDRDSDALSQPLIIISLVVVLINAFFTNALGVHAIFGAFITGLILPRHGNFTEKLTEKLEEFVSSILLPLYCTYSGLKTNIGAINSGPAWIGFIIVFVACMFGKVFGCSMAARICGHISVESIAVGVLMNTKGLMEIIILNFGIKSKVINEEVFAIMVLLAIVNTLATSPLISIIYPEAYHYNLSVKVKHDSATPLVEHRLYLLCIPNASSVSSMMKIVHYISGSAQSAWTTLHAVRLRPLHDRMSSVITAFSSASNHHINDDHLINAFKMFGSIRGLEIISHTIIAQVKDYAKDIAKLAYEIDSDMVIVPYPRKFVGKKITGAVSEHPKSHDLFATWYGTNESPENIINAEVHEDAEDILKYAVSDALVTEVTSQLVKKARIPIGVLVERSTLESERKPVILVPFFGGPDDRQALLVGMRLATLPGAELAILHIRTLQKLGDVETEVESEKTSPLLQKLRRRILNSKEPNSSLEEDFSQTLPDGVSVFPVDAEDARFIDMVLNYSGPARGIPVAQSSPAIEENTGFLVSPSGLLPPPSNSVPFRRVSTSGSAQEDTVTPNSSIVGSNIPKNIDPPKVIQHRPTIHLTEIAAFDPTEALMEALRSSEANAFTMIVAGHYGPSYSAAAIVHEGGKAGNKNGETRSSTVTMSSYWGEITMNTVQGNKATTNTEASVDERVLGPIGSSIVNSGSCDRASLLVVRKFRLAAGGANDF